MVRGGGVVSRRRPSGGRDLPDLLDYDVIGGRQTYPSFEGTPLFPFGHGLSYASFRYGDLSAQVREGPVR
ncbi:hypothetical protein [Streptomyces violaceorubidus]|uniref:hypothetical protein n=1 Tax=Streptomyces violaceorubidus TaxID=284042 RepID=UPI003D9F70BB